jgi:hypothetical protein
LLLHENKTPKCKLKVANLQNKIMNLLFVPKLCQKL